MKQKYTVEALKLVAFHAQWLSGTFKTKSDLLLATNDRKLVSAITQLRTGHGCFNSYLHGISRAEEVVGPLCSCRLGEAQTPQHLILSCRHSWMARKAPNEAFGKRRKLRLQPLPYGKSGFAVPCLENSKF
jgi:hypothetical protein